MSYRLKVFSGALAAMCALAVVVSSVAVAGDYTASSYPTTVTGESAKGNDVLTTEAGKVECKSHFKGTLSSAFFSIEIKPTYSECRAFGFLSATVEVNNCAYVLESPSGGFDSYSATWGVACWGGSPITITASTCQMTIGSQTTIPSVTLTNNTAAGDISVIFENGGLGFGYTVTKDGFACPFNGTGVKSGGQYVQGSAVTFDSTNGATVDVGF